MRRTKICLAFLMVLVLAMTLVVLAACPDDVTQYTVTIVEKGTGVASQSVTMAGVEVPTGTQVPAGTQLTVAWEASTGYTAKLLVNGTQHSTTSPATVTVNADTTIKIEATADPVVTNYTVTIVAPATGIASQSVKNGSADVATGASVPAGTVLTVTWSPTSGYTNVLWIDDSATTMTSPASVTVNADTKIEVKATAIPPTVTKVEVDGEASIVWGTTATETLTYTATVTGTNNPAQTVKWASSVVTVATIDEDTGVITIVGIGTTRITATSTVDNTKSGYIDVEITKANPDPLTGTVTASATTDASITVTPVTGAEYQIQLGTAAATTNGWQTSNEFTGLTRGTSYTVYVRIKATTTHNASNAISAVISTANSVLSDAEAAVALWITLPQLAEFDAIVNSADVEAKIALFEQIAVYFDRYAGTELESEFAGYLCQLIDNDIFEIMNRYYDTQEIIEKMQAALEIVGLIEGLPQSIEDLKALEDLEAVTESLVAIDEFIDAFGNDDPIIVAIIEANIAGRKVADDLLDCLALYKKHIALIETADELAGWINKLSDLDPAKLLLSDKDAVDAIRAIVNTLADSGEKKFVASCLVANLESGEFDISNYDAADFEACLEKYEFAIYLLQTKDDHKKAWDAFVGGLSKDDFGDATIWALVDGIITQFEADLANDEVATTAEKVHELFKAAVFAIQELQVEDIVKDHKANLELLKGTILQEDFVFADDDNDPTTPDTNKNWTAIQNEFTKAAGLLDALKTNFEPAINETGDPINNVDPVGVLYAAAQDIYLEARIAIGEAQIDEAHESQTARLEAWFAELEEEKATEGGWADIWDDIEDEKDAGISAMTAAYGNATHLVGATLDNIDTLLGNALTAIYDAFGWADLKINWLLFICEDSLIEDQFDSDVWEAIEGIVDDVDFEQENLTIEQATEMVNEAVAAITALRLQQALAEYEDAWDTFKGGLKQTDYVDDPTVWTAIQGFVSAYEADLAEVETVEELKNLYDTAVFNIRDAQFNFTIDNHKKHLELFFAGLDATDFRNGESNQNWIDIKKLFEDAIKDIEGLTFINVKGGHETNTETINSVYQTAQSIYNAARVAISLLQLEEVNAEQLLRFNEIYDEYFKEAEAFFTNNSDLDDLLEAAKQVGLAAIETAYNNATTVITGWVAYTNSELTKVETACTNALKNIAKIVAIYEQVERFRDFVATCRELDGALKVNQDKDCSAELTAGIAAIKAAENIDAALLAFDAAVKAIDEKWQGDALSNHRTGNINALVGHVDGVRVHDNAQTEAAEKLTAEGWALIEQALADGIYAIKQAAGGDYISEARKEAIGIITTIRFEVFAQKACKLEGPGQVNAFKAAREAFYTTVVIPAYIAAVEGAGDTFGDLFTEMRGRLQDEIWPPFYKESCVEYFRVVLTNNIKEADFSSGTFTWEEVQAAFTAEEDKIMDSADASAANTALAAAIATIQNDYLLVEQKARQIQRLDHFFGLVSKDVEKYADVKILWDDATDEINACEFSSLMNVAESICTDALKELKKLVPGADIGQPDFGA